MEEAREIWVDRHLDDIHGKATHAWALARAVHAETLERLDELADAHRPRAVDVEVAKGLLHLPLRVLVVGHLCVNVRPQLLLETVDVGLGDVLDDGLGLAAIGALLEVRPRAGDHRAEVVVGVNRA